MVRLLSLLTSAVSVLAVPFPIIETRAAPNASLVYISGYSYSGSGCPAGTSGYTLSDDRSVLTLSYGTAFQAQTYPGSRPSDRFKSCQVILSLHYPPGYTFAIIKTDVRGYGSLDANVTAVQENIYYISGQSAQASTRSTFKGPQQGDYLDTDYVGTESLIWAPCGKTYALNVVSSVRIAAAPGSSGSGIITEMSTNNQVNSLTYGCGIQWKKC